MLSILLTVKNFFSKPSSFKVIVVLVIQAKKQIVCQFPATFIVSTIYSCKSKTIRDALRALALYNWKVFFLP